MAVVVRLLTVVDIDERNCPLPLREHTPLLTQLRHRGGPVPPFFREAARVGPPPTERHAPDLDHSQGFSAVLLAVLDDGRRLTLPDDRGWGSAGSSGIWGRTSIEEIEQSALAAVGPDDEDTEDFDERFFGARRRLLGAAVQSAAQAGVFADAKQLRRLPNDVEMSQQILDRIANA